MSLKESMGFFTDKELYRLSNMLLTSQQRKFVLSFLYDADKVNREFQSLPPDIITNKDILFEIIDILYKKGDIKRTIHWYVIYRIAQESHLYSDSEFTRFKKDIFDFTGCDRPFLLSQMTSFSTTFLSKDIDSWSECIYNENGKNLDCLVLVEKIKKIFKDKKAFSK